MRHSRSRAALEAELLATRLSASANDEAAFEATRGATARFEAQRRKYARLLGEAREEADASIARCATLERERDRAVQSAAAAEARCAELAAERDAAVEKLGHAELDARNAELRMGVMASSSRQALLTAANEAAAAAQAAQRTAEASEAQMRAELHAAYGALQRAESRLRRLGPPPSDAGDAAGHADDGAGDQRGRHAEEGAPRLTPRRRGGRGRD